MWLGNSPRRIIVWMRLPCSFVVAAGVAAGFAAVPTTARAQSDARSDTVAERTVVVPATPDDERLRLDQLLGRSTTAGYLLRSPSATLGPLPPGDSGVRWAPLSPQLLVIRNSALPFSLNTGALSAGRGISTQVTAGIQAQWRSFSLVLAPSLIYEQNLGFLMPPGFWPATDRSSWSSPWHDHPYSMDLPIRYGNRARLLIDPGQTSLTYRRGALAVGLATENRWWGPGVRNAILLSSNAAGFPHLFVRTGRPVHTRIGSFEAILLLGGLWESRFFDTTSTNDLRSYSALAVTWVPPGEPGLTLGLSRAVYAPVSGWSGLPWRLFDAVFRRVGQPNSLPVSAPDTTSGPDQVFSLFARWLFPGDGLEAYAEWARYELPSSLRAILTSPGHTQGYTLGLQWARPVGASGGAVRLQAEHTFLEQDPSFADQPLGSWYTSRAVDQGYTVLGKVIGATIGPGASSHWLAADYVGRRTQAGVFAGRIRWEDDTLYRIKGVNTGGNTWCSHDVSVFVGVRGGRATRYGAVSASLTLARRWNLYFLHDTTCGDDRDPSRIVDRDNVTLEFRLAPRLR